MQPRDILIDGAVAQTAPLDLHVCIYMAGIISNEFPITHEGISRMASSPTEVAISERVAVRGSIAGARRHPPWQSSSRDWSTSA
jgi:hypothetical protein